MTWQFNPYAIPLFFSAVFVAVIVYTAWRQRANLAARLFLGFTGAALGLVLTYAFELLSADLQSMLFWLRFEYLFHWGMVFWPLFAIAYSGYESWLTRRRVLAFFIVPVIILVLVWTNQAHGLIWQTTAARLVGSLAMFDRTYGFAFWVWMAYLGSMFLAGDFILIRKAVRAPEYFQGQLGWLVLAFFMPFVAIVLTIARLTPIPLLDLSPFGVALACVPVAVSLFRFHLFDLIPAAYELVIESMGDAVIVCDAKSRVVQANSATAQLTGRTASKLVGGTIEQVFAAIGDPHLEQSVLDTDRSQQEIAIRVGADLRYFDVRMSPLRNHQRMVTGQVFVLREITDRRRAEQQSFELAVERERVHVLATFIQDSSHDFRTPITTILTSAYLLDKLGESAGEHLASLIQPAAAPKPEQLHASLSEIAAAIASMREKAQATQTSAARLENLVASILEILELEREPLFAFEPLDLNRVVGECVQVSADAAAEKNVPLHFEPDSALPPVNADEWKLRRAVLKLVDNAIQYTAPGSAVSISTDRRDGEAVIEISDSGIGISADDLPHIFEPFYRADRARSDATGGVGLGLSIAKRIIDAHAGRIEVESAPETGSVFRICLPLNPEADGR